MSGDASPASEMPRKRSWALACLEAAVSQRPNTCCSNFPSAPTKTEDQWGGGGGGTRPWWLALFSLWRRLLASRL